MTGESWSRRRALLAAGSALLPAAAGCVGAGDPRVDGTRTATASRSPCSGALEVVELAADIEGGSAPTVEFRLRNAGDRPVAYELVVVFERKTSTGLDARTGRARLVGTLSPGERVERTATTDAPSAGNTTGYERHLSVSCA